MFFVDVHIFEIFSLHQYIHLLALLRINSSVFGITKLQKCKYSQRLLLILTHARAHTHTHTHTPRTHTHTLSAYECVHIKCLLNIFLKIMEAYMEQTALEKFIPLVLQDSIITTVKSY